MLTPPRCPTCGLPIGDVAVIYRELRRRLFEETLKKKGKKGALKFRVLPTQVVVDARLKISMDAVLAGLQINDDCCRMHLSTVMDWRDYY